MKSTLFVFACLFFLHSVSAQHSFSLGPQLNVVSKFSRFYNAGVGGSLEYLHRSSNSLALRASLGYDYFKSELERDYKSFVPARVGLQGFLTRNFFVSGDVGIGFYNDVNTNNESGLTFAFGTGCQLPVATTHFVQLSANYIYHRYPPSLLNTWFSFRAAYGLSWGKNR